MASELKTNESISDLVGGIVSDAQSLMKQNLSLFRLEVKEDIRKSLLAIGALAIGAVLLTIAGVMLCFMLAHMIDAMTEDSMLPLWACFGLVGAGVGILGSVLLASGMWRFQTFNPLPDESAKALQENMRWMTNSK